MKSSNSNKKFIIDTNRAPRAIGPYSQGVTYGGLLFVSGQIPMDPESGEVSQGGIEAQTRQAMNNLQAVLMAAGLDFTHVLKTTVYLRNMNDYQLMNDVYGLFFDHSPPARAAVEVSRLPKDVLVEIDCIAAAPTDYEARTADTTPSDHPGPETWDQAHAAPLSATDEEEPLPPEDDEPLSATDEQEPLPDDDAGKPAEPAVRVPPPTPKLAGLKIPKPSTEEE